MNDKFIELLRKRIAKTSIGASTARGMGPKGTVAAARDYLGELKLSEFSISTEKEFKSVLDCKTSKYCNYQKLPDGTLHWGAARKFLNPFLRDIVHNKYLCEKYHLSQIEPWLEIPLDSNVGKQLRREPEGQVLPRWTTVTGRDGIDKQKNKKYQDVASQVAERQGVLRIHLDLRYFPH